MINVVNIKDYKFEDIMLSPSDLKKIFRGKTDATFLNWAKRGLLKKYKIGGCVFYKADDVKKLIEQSAEE
ncbi:MAG: helix-turn-helix domain-containing protein [Candidatus Gastranaerophilales bacterium]|nr:helix-turn-helix domain-containing protein [Candidatus Gastranaerophilales bacterium]